MGPDDASVAPEGAGAVVVRRATPAGFLVGRSTHSLAELAAARAEGADYAFFGPILPTPSKSVPDRTHGISSLVDAAALGLPVIAIGGIGPDEAPAALGAGAAGVAAIRAFADLDSAARLVTAVADVGSDR